MMDRKFKLLVLATDENIMGFGGHIQNQNMRRDAVFEITDRKSSHSNVRSFGDIPHRGSISRNDWIISQLRNITADFVVLCCDFSKYRGNPNLTKTREDGDIVFLTHSNFSEVSVNVGNKTNINYELYCLLYWENMAIKTEFALRLAEKGIFDTEFAAVRVFDEARKVVLCHPDLMARNFQAGASKIKSLRDSHDYYLKKEPQVSVNIGEFVSDPKVVHILKTDSKIEEVAVGLCQYFSDIVDSRLARKIHQTPLPFQASYQEAIVGNQPERLAHILRSVEQQGFRRGVSRHVDFSHKRDPLALRKIRPPAAVLKRVGGVKGLVRKLVPGNYGPFDFGANEPGGFGSQRDGWNFVMQSLLERFGHADNGLGLDGFLEKSFVWNFSTVMQHRYNKPWMGIAHRPPNIPDFYEHRFSAQFYENPFFYHSSKGLKGIVALSSEHAMFLNRLLNIPTKAILHPTNHDVAKWDLEKYRSSPTMLVQIGSWLRKLHSIYLLPSGNFQKKILAPSIRWLLEDRRFAGEAALLREEGWDLQALYTTVEVLSFLPNNKYDELLTECIIFLDLYDATANNTVLEAIARHTPIIVRRLPATTEYLGEAYPLFFDTLEEAAALAMDREKIIAAHFMLKQLSTDVRFHMRGFCAELQNARLEFENQDARR